MSQYNPYWIRLGVAAAMMGLMLAPSLAQQSYPDRPIRLIVPFPPGGITDTSARVISDKLGSRLGQPVVIENRGGASGNIGTQLVAQAAPDGYMLLLGFDSTLVVNPHIYPNIPFDTIRDFAPVSLLGDVNLIVVAHPSLPACNLMELTALSKQKPGSVSYGSAGIGSAGHLIIEMLRAHTGMDVTHIPYKGGGPAMLDVVAGQIPLVGTGVASAIQYVKQGRVIALGVSSARRDPALPDVPTFAESGAPGFVAVSWAGIVAPAKTPRPIIDRLHRELQFVLNEPDIRERYAAIGIIPRGSTPEEYAELIRADLAKWEKVIKQAGIKVE